jgi:hypothetical protein
MDDTTEMSMVQEPTIASEVEVPDTNVDTEIEKYDVAQSTKDLLHGKAEDEMNMTTAIEDLSINISTEIVDETFISTKDPPTNSEIEVVEETIIDETSSVGNFSSALVNSEGETREGVIVDTSNVDEIITDGIPTAEAAPPSPITDEALTSESPILSLKPENDILSTQVELELEPEPEPEPQVEVEVNVVQSMKDKLHGLILELQTATLSREEANSFEDMFMDAKLQLYAAERRGRNLG